MVACFSFEGTTYCPRPHFPFRSRSAALGMKKQLMTKMTREGVACLDHSSSVNPPVPLKLLSLSLSLTGNGMEQLLMSKYALGSALLVGESTCIQ